MAQSLPIGSTHNWAEQVWAKAVEHETERQTVGMSFLGKGPDATLMLREELSTKRGQKVTLKFSPTEEVDGISQGQSVYKNAQKINTFDDEVSINYLGFPYGLEGPMDQQRTASDLKKIVFHKAAVQWKRRWETVIMNHLAGNTAANSQGSGGAHKYVGHNAVTDIDTDNHLLRPKGHTTDALVAGDTSATANLDMILKLEVSAMSASYLTYPIAPGQDGYYDLIIHPMQWEQLRQNSTAGEWEDIQLAEIKGGKKIENTGLHAGWMGVYSRTRIHVSDYVPQGHNSGTAQANSRRMIFAGRCAGAMAFGEGYASGSHLDWSEAVHEHKKWSLLVDSVFGFKAIFFNSIPYGVMGFTTYTEN